MNKNIIKVNGVEINLDAVNSKESTLAITETELDNMSAMLAKESEDLSKQVKAVSLLSDIKTVESFGYKATESISENIKSAGTYILNKVSVFFKNALKFIKSIIPFFKKKIKSIEFKSIVSEAEHVINSKQLENKLIDTRINHESFEIHMLTKDALINASKFVKETSDIDRYFKESVDKITELSTKFIELVDSVNFKAGQNKSDFKEIHDLQLPEINKLYKISSEIDKIMEDTTGYNTLFAQDTDKTIDVSYDDCRDLVYNIKLFFSKEVSAICSECLNITDDMIHMEKGVPSKDLVNILISTGHYLNTVVSNINKEISKYLKMLDNVKTDAYKILYWVENNTNK